VEFKLDPIHVVGYVGALGSLVFGTNQLLILLRKHRAKDVSTFDYGVRTTYAVLLGIYSIGISNLLFVVVNFGAAILSAAVMVVAMRVKKENRSARGRKAAAHRRDAA
jgi:hypothetical protein